jgi:hypothetical protein
VWLKLKEQLAPQLAQDNKILKQGFLTQYKKILRTEEQLAAHAKYQAQLHQQAEEVKKL